MSSVRAGRVVLLVGTRKGVFLLHGDEERRRFTLDGPHFLGHLAYHVVCPRPWMDFL